MAAQSSIPNCRINTARVYVRRVTATVAIESVTATAAMGTLARDCASDPEAILDDELPMQVHAD